MCTSNRLQQQRRQTLQNHVTKLQFSLHNFSFLKSEFDFINISIVVIYLRLGNDMLALLRSMSLWRQKSQSIFLLRHICVCMCVYLFLSFKYIINYTGLFRYISTINSKWKIHEEFKSLSIHKNIICVLFQLTVLESIFKFNFKFRCKSLKVGKAVLRIWVCLYTWTFLKGFTFLCEKGREWRREGEKDRDIFVSFGSFSKYSLTSL